MSIYSETMSNTPEIVDLQCGGCDFECGTVGFCLKECGENYIILRLLIDKGYIHANLDYCRLNDEKVTGIELYKRQSKRFIENMNRLGYTCSIVPHEYQKKHLCTVVIDGENPIDIAYDFLKLDVIK